MRKLNLCLVLFLLLAAPAFAASVSRSMVPRADPGSVVTVTFSIGDTKAGELFTLEDQIPDGWAIRDWSVGGATEAQDKITTRFQAPKYGWSFTPSGSSASISYTVTAPSKEGTYSFNAVWFDSSGQSTSTQSLQVRAVRCGDGICEGAETSDNCVQDCPVATTLPATTATMPSVTTTTALTTLAPGEVHNPIFIVLVILLVILLILLIVVRKKKKDSMVSI